MASTARIEELRKKYEENQRRYFAPLANEYRKAGQLEEAIALCRAWLPQQPGHMSGHIVFGQTLFEAGELSEARSVFETALELDPENLIALRHLGDIARQHGEVDSARSWYKRVLDADPRNDEIAALLSELDTMPAGVAPVDVEPPAPEAPSWGEVVAEVHTPIIDASIEVSVQEDSAETAAWSAGTEAGREAPPAAPADEASALFDTAGTVAFQDDTTPLDDEYRQLAIDAAASMAMDAPAEGASESGAPAAAEPVTSEAFQNDVSEVPPANTSAANELGLEVMEFVPPPRDSTRAPRGEPSPFDGHLLTDDADGSGATPAAFVTETMAELYLQQGFRDEALGVYKQLLQQNPDDEGLRDRVAQLESGSRSSVGMAAISDEVIESAQRRQVAHTPPSMRAFLAKLAVRRAPRRGPDAVPDSTEGEEGEGDSQGARAEPVDPAPDSGPSGIDNDPAAWQLAPEPDAQASGEESPYAPDAPDPDADTAEWIAEDAERLSVVGTAAAESGEQALSSAEDHGGTGLIEDAPMAHSSAPDEVQSRAGSNGAPTSTTPGTQRAVGAVGSLFSGAIVQASDEAAAKALASAFAPQAEGRKDAMVGRPTRAAKSEISLDHVFRESGSRPAASRERSSFSFDQFFSENASGGGAAAGEGSGVPDDDAPGDDIEQFNSWLEGLKKK